jgi:uncharacterized membrane protein YdjX (TVP38/TMEM64 family)
MTMTTGAGGVRRWRRYVAGATLLAFTALGLAALLFPLDVGVRMAAWLEHAGDGPWAPFIGIAAFVALASIGAPQIVLITALVAAFGPWAGFLYSWIGKVISCAVGFFMGRRLGADALARHASPDAALLMQELARRGFWASALVRLVPTVPSVVVNVAAGCTPMRFGPFIAGAAVGSVPKLALIAFAGHSAMSGLAGAGASAWLSLGGAILMMLLVAWVGRNWLKRRRAEIARENNPGL